MPGAIVRVDARGKLTTREGTALHDITAKRVYLLLQSRARSKGLLLQFLDYERRQSSPPALQPGI